MRRETRFGEIRSFEDLHLIQQKVDVQPAEPKLKLIDIPGANGSKDLSELPAGRITYKDRKITWTFALYPGDSWEAKHSQVSNALNGIRCEIHLFEDLDWHYEGRLTVKKYNKDKALRQITVEATCYPYKLKNTLSGGDFPVTTARTDFMLHNEHRPAVPEFLATVETEIFWGDRSVVIAPGVWYSSLDIELPKGDNIIGLRGTKASGQVQIQYREGSL